MRAEKAPIAARGNVPLRALHGPCHPSIKATAPWRSGTVVSSGHGTWRAGVHVALPQMRRLPHRNGLHLAQCRQPGWGASPSAGKVHRQRPTSTWADHGGATRITHRSAVRRTRLARRDTTSARIGRACVRRLGHRDDEGLDSPAVSEGVQPFGQLLSLDPRSPLAVSQAAPSSPWW